MHFKPFTYLLVVGLSFAACDRSIPKSSKTNVNTTRVNTVKLAKRFAIVREASCKWVYLFGDRNTADTTSSFLLADDTLGLKQRYPFATVVKTPLTKVAALGSIYATMLDSLGVLESLWAIDDIRYVSNQHILQKHKQKALLELALNPQIDVEACVKLNPQMLFVFGMGQGEKDIDKKMALTQLPICIIIDHLEETPLSRAEWIKLVAAFFNKDQRADDLFNACQVNYLNLKSRASMAKTKPRVFTEAKYGDVWYMPGGKSFMATLIQDAGGDYLWKENQQVGSIPLSLEQVVAKAKQADIWLNPSQSKSLNELLQSEKRYTVFKAFQTGQVYNNNLHLNAYGYSDYWESALIFPDRILSDLIHIFHPELKPDSSLNLNYYQRLPFK